MARPKSGVAHRVERNSIFGPRFFVYFFINGKSKSPAAWASTNSYLQTNSQESEHLSNRIMKAMDQACVRLASVWAWQVRPALLMPGGLVPYMRGGKKTFIPYCSNYIDTQGRGLLRPDSLPARSRFGKGRRGLERLFNITSNYITRALGHVQPKKFQLIRMPQTSVAMAKRVGTLGWLT